MVDPVLLTAFCAEKPYNPLCLLHNRQSPATYLEKLVHAGYKIDRFQAFDMFPQTIHVKTLAVYNRG